MRAWSRGATSLGASKAEPSMTQEPYNFSSSAALSSAQAGIASAARKVRPIACRMGNLRRAGNSRIVVQGKGIWGSCPENPG